METSNTIQNERNDSFITINGISIQSYFEKVRELLKSGKGFPVNLDDVWELVYSRRDKAINELRKNFIEGEDFNLHQMGKVVKNSQLQNGIRVDVYLSVSAMEFFIAKKRKEVFEVYRKVFHKALDEKENDQSLSVYSNDPFIQLRINQIDQEKRISEVEHQVKVLEAKTHTRPEFYAVSGYAALNNIKVNMTQAATIGKKATQICKEQGIIPGDTFDPRFGKVHTYPYEILDSVFSTTINISNT